MIRFLQKDNRVVKILFVVIIAVACSTMVITLVPGIFNDQAATADTYATIRAGGFLGRFFGPSDEISNTELQATAQRMLQQQKLPDFVLPYMMQRVGQGMIQQHVELAEANHLGLQISDQDVLRFLSTGQFGQVLFPKGQYIGDQRYAEFVQEQFNLSRAAFEKEVKQLLQEQRLKALVTGGVTVSDNEIRSSYLQQATKIKFDYAVISSEDLRKTINPTDTELQAFFQQSAGRYAHAIPETRKIAYVAFNNSAVAASAPQVSDQEVQQYYTQHQKDYQVEDQAKVRHILIKVAAGADAKADGAARAKAQDILDQIHKGGNFADLAKKNSDDPGSKEQGGELGFLKHGATVPEFDKAAFSIAPGQTSGLIKTQFGYHILQVEERQTAHLRPLDEVKPTIVAVLTRQKEAQAEQAFAMQLQADAKKNGLAGAAAAHHLNLVNTDFIEQAAVIPGLADGSKILSQAFSSKPGGDPDIASTGDGYAVFQVSEIKAAHAPSFADYKSHLLEDYREQQLPQLLTRKTNELADRAHADKDLAKAAKEVGAIVKTSDLVARDAQVPEVGQLSSVAPGLFDLNPGQFSQAINTGHSGIVAKLTDKQQPNTDDIAKNFDTTRDTVLNQRREEMFEVFVTNLTDQYKKEGRIRMNQKAPATPTMPGAPGLPGSRS
jgi:peptidyl-prolyl cis-trans isomerase D